MGENAKADRDLVLVVEDDREQRTLLKRWIGREGYAVETFEDAESCLAALPTLIPSAVCTDMHMPGMSGIDLLGHIRKTHPHLPALFLTADADVDLVVAAVRVGATDYLVKPVDRNKLLSEIRNAVNNGRLALRVAQLEREVGGGYPGIIGESAPMLAMFRQMDRLAACDITVLIRGESGTGKELVSRAVHNASGRKKGPFVAINCAAIPTELIESELFGHERGAFTGATDKKAGRFTEANGGTIFLDEIGELDQSLQSKLLRVLQERVFRPVGGTKDIRSDFRLIAASHRDLHEDVSSGRFREDLFFRIAVFELDVPPLRDRRDDIDTLVEFFVRKHCNEQISITPEAMEFLRQLNWPGNVRQLENAIQHALVVCDQKTLRPSDLPPRLRTGEPGESPDAPSATWTFAKPADTPLPTPVEVPAEPSAFDDDAPVIPLEELERRAIQHAMKRTSGNLSAAGRLLGIGRTTLYRKIKQYGME